MEVASIVCTQTANAILLSSQDGPGPAIGLDSRIFRVVQRRRKRGGHVPGAATSSDGEHRKRSGQTTAEVLRRHPVGEASLTNRQVTIIIP